MMDVRSRLNLSHTKEMINIHQLDRHQARYWLHAKPRVVLDLNMANLAASNIAIHLSRHRMANCLSHHPLRPGDGSVGKAIPRQ
jgi:hypothetical protein